MKLRGTGEGGTAKSRVIRGKSIGNKLCLGPKDTMVWPHNTKQERVQRLEHWHWDGNHKEKGLEKDPGEDGLMWWKKV